MGLEVSRQVAFGNMNAGIDFLVLNLGLDEAAAADMSTVVMRGPDPRCGEMTVGEFFTSEHGQERGPEHLDLIRDEIAKGADVEQALLLTFGRSAFYKTEDGGLRRRNQDSHKDTTPHPPAGLEKK